MMTKDGLFHSSLLNEILERQFNIPVHLISECPVTSPGFVSRYFGWLGFWAGMLTILVGFSALEFRLENSMDGFTRIATLFLLVAFEFGVIYEWNKIFG